MTTNALTFMKNEEDKRHNIEMEKYYAEQNVIGARNATSNEVQAAAATRNAASNERNAQTNAWQAQIQSDYNVGWLDETQRHNQRMEQVQMTGAIFQGLGMVSPIVGGWLGVA